jgi:hypothetical protein
VEVFASRAMCLSRGKPWLDDWLDSVSNSNL